MKEFATNHYKDTNIYGPSMSVVVWMPSSFEVQVDKLRRKIRWCEGRETPMNEWNWAWVLSSWIGKVGSDLG